MAQTSYPLAPPVAIEGMFADLADSTVESRANTNLTNSIGFGKLVKEDILAPATGCEPCVVAADVPFAVVLHSHAYERLNELDADGVRPYGEVNCVRRGRVYVLAGGTIAPGDRLAYNPTTKKFLATHMPGTTIDITGQAVARGPAVADGLFVAEFDFLNKP